MMDTDCLFALCRYLGRKKCVQSVCVQPPFLRPQLTEAQLAAKILDNGIQGDLHRVRTGWVLRHKFCASYRDSVWFKPELKKTKKGVAFACLALCKDASEKVCTWKVCIQAAPDGSQRFKSCYKIQKSCKVTSVNTTQPHHQPRQTDAS